ncbi:MAG TPA: hypothetical protein VFU02_12095 [Polyangiaceae bacterium]|nr:hypothetical protein [Polyangiaceae bacterium]
MGASSGPDSHAATPPVVEVEVDAVVEVEVDAVIDMLEVVAVMPEGGPMLVPSPPALAELACVVAVAAAPPLPEVNPLPVVPVPVVAAATVLAVVCPKPPVVVPVAAPPTPAAAALVLPLVVMPALVPPLALVDSAAFDATSSPEELQAHSGATKSTAKKLVRNFIGAAFGSVLAGWRIHA